MYHEGDLMTAVATVAHNWLEPNTAGEWQGNDTFDCYPTFYPTYPTYPDRKSTRLNSSH